MLYYKNIRTGMYHIPKTETTTVCNCDVTQKHWDKIKTAQAPPVLLCTECLRHYTFAKQTGRITVE